MQTLVSFTTLEPWFRASKRFGYPEYPNFQLPLWVLNIFNVGWSSASDGLRYGAYFTMMMFFPHAVLCLLLLLPMFSSEELYHKLRSCKADFLRRLGHSQNGSNFVKKTFRVILNRIFYTRVPKQFRKKLPIRKKNKNSCFCFWRPYWNDPVRFMY